MQKYVMAIVSPRASSWELLSIIKLPLRHVKTAYGVLVGTCVCFSLEQRVRNCLSV